MEPNHITAGRTALRALLVLALLTTAVVGATGTTTAEPIDGKGNDVCPCGHQSVGSVQPFVVEVGPLDISVDTFAVPLASGWSQDMDPY